ncbi:MAG: exodeoxyribonuclease VII large subunit [Bacteroidota bacterium]
MPKNNKNNINDIPSVSELTHAISHVLEDNFLDINVQGEISNFKLHSSGHRYFTLKDNEAQISCTMWRTKQLNFTPSDGMRVIASGSVTVYPPRGQYQLECESLSPAGQGDLFLAFEALKLKLETLGYFAPDRKKDIPDLPLNIGVSTSPTGAAVRDILTTMERRFPIANIFFRPTLVQGDGAAEDIAKAIIELQSTPAEVLIVGRGGGSLEDLWAYNTETVADAIFNCNLPVISAVGHETDFTIADFVADLRAATPTAAAELVTPVTRENFYDEIDSIRFDMLKSVKGSIDELNDTINYILDAYAFRRFDERIKMHQQLIDDMQSQIESQIKRNYSNVRDRFSFLESHLKSLYPLSPFDKGFAMLKSAAHFIKSNETLGNYLVVDIVRKNETASAYINKVIPVKQNKS